MNLRAPLSLGAVALLTCTLIWVSSLYPRWQKPGSEATLSWDVFGYYLYLPAAFIYDDLGGLGFIKHISDTYHPAGDFHHATQQADGRWVMKYPIGMALLYSPFFGIGHLAAGLQGAPQDGFSQPYQMAISFGMLFYAFLGLWFLRKVLLRYFSDGVSALTLAVIVLATNYLNYTAFDGAMAHNSLFTLFAAILLLTASWHEQARRWKALLLGVCIGLCAIVRPTEIMIAMVPALWGVRNLPSLREKIRLLWSRWPDVLLLGLAVLLTGSIQLLYWKVYSGHWLFYSYGDFGFYWSRPQILNGLFSFRKGWFLYTPVMVLAMLGFVPLFRRQQGLFWTVALFFALTVYVAFAWEVWWYGGSFGARPLVQSYALLALPLASLLSLLPGRRWASLLTAAFVLACIWLNGVMHWQAHGPETGWSAEYMTKAFYLRTFGSLHPKKADRKFLDVRHELSDTTGMEIKHVYLNDFETDTTIQRSEISPPGGRYTCMLDPAKPFSPAYEVALGAAGLKPGDWVRVRGTFYFTEMEWDVWQMTQLVTMFLRDGKSYRETNGRIQRIVEPGQWTSYQYEMKVPENARPEDVLKIYVWNPSQHAMWIDNLQADLIFKK